MHAQTIGIVFASSKPIGIEYYFDDVWFNVCASTVHNWTIEFIQFNFWIAHQWKKDGCQRVCELGLYQLCASLLSLVLLNSGSLLVIFSMYHPPPISVMSFWTFCLGLSDILIAWGICLNITFIALIYASHIALKCPRSNLSHISIKLIVSPNASNCFYCCTIRYCSISNTEQLKNTLYFICMLLPV